MRQRQTMVCPPQRRCTFSLTWACLLAALAGAVVAAAPPSRALAQPADAEAKALELASRAKASFQRGEFQQAAMLFKQAFAQVPEPTLLFNAARAYQRGGMLAEALSVFRLYLTLATHDDAETRAGRAEAVEHVQSIERELARAATAARPPAVTPAPTAGGGAGASTTPAGSVPAPTGPTPAGPAPADPTAGGGGTSAPILDAPPPAVPAVRRPGLFERVYADSYTNTEIAALSLMGGGGAVFLAGLIAHAAIGGELDAVEARLASAKQVTADGTFYPGVTQREVDGAVRGHDSARTVANVVLVCGAVAGGVGGALWLLRDGAGTNVTALRPHASIGPGEVSLGWSLRW